MTTSSRHLTSRTLIPRVAAAAVLLLASAVHAASGTPLLELTFDNASPGLALTAPFTYTAAGGGVSGNSSDKALSGGSTMGGSSGTASLANVGSTFDGLASFTLTGWFNASATPGSSARLLQTQNVTLLWQTNSGTGTGLRLALNGSTATELVSYSPDYMAAGTWTFFAITYYYSSEDPLANNVKFYASTDSTDVRLVETFTLDKGVVNTATTNTALYLGSNTGTNRAFSGLMDNFRIYGSTTDASGALGLSDLQVIRAADLAAASIPEPSTIIFLMGMLAIGLGICSRRRSL